ncbi:MAG: hypothetical protein KH009_02485 [Clostridiales bacterium]|nr:hypothetical protein [Clostridiales bacterium]
MEQVKVLFLGNSHTFFNDMPSIFQMLCEESGTARADVVMQAHPGVHLQWHLSQQWELRYGLVQSGFDYLVFQQAAHPCPPLEETLPDARHLIGMARDAGVTPIATVTWAEKRFPENQQKMYDIFDAVQAETGVICSPVGQVFQRVAEEEPDIDLYWVDGEHASPYGSYVVAACAYARIFGKSPVGLPARSICNIPADREKFEEIGALRRRAAEEPENSELLRQAEALSKEVFTPIYDREKLWIDLDPGKTARLQRIIAEEIQRFDAAHA